MITFASLLWTVDSLCFPHTLHCVALCCSLHTIDSLAVMQPAFAEAMGVDQFGRVAQVGSFEEVLSNVEGNVVHVGTHPNSKAHHAELGRQN